MSFWFKRPLYFKIFVMMGLGCAVGYFVGPDVKVISPIGDAFIKLLKMLIIPLTFFTILSGVTKLSSPSEFKKIGGMTCAIFILSTIFAVAFGVLLAFLIRPGQGAQGLLGFSEVSYKEYSAVETVLAWIPENVVKSMVGMDMVPVIVFAIIFGICLMLIGEKAEPVNKVIQSCTDAMLKMTELVTELAPYGIFALTAVMVGTMGGKMLEAAAKFVIADYLGLLALLLIGYPILLKVMAGVNAVTFYRKIAPAMLIAASTTSSAATLPMSMKMAKERLGLPEKIYGFALPLGATVNMNGFAVSLGIISMLALDVYNIPLTPIMFIQILTLGLVLAIGAAGVKGTAVVVSAVLFESLGIPLGLLPLIAAIWPVVDIGHTTVNITGDLMAATIVGVKNNDIDWDIYNNESLVKE